MGPSRSLAAGANLTRYADPLGPDHGPRTGCSANGAGFLLSVQREWKREGKAVLLTGGGDLAAQHRHATFGARNSTAMGTFELFQDKTGDHRFRLKDAKGNMILSSDGYGSKAEAEEGVELAQKLAPEAMNYERKRTDTGHSFMLQTYNGEVVGTSEVYATTAERDKGIEAVKKQAPGAEVVVV